jgi:hypothetical protein
MKHHCLISMLAGSVFGLSAIGVAAATPPPVTTVLQSAPINVSYFPNNSNRVTCAITQVAPPVQGFLYSVALYGARPSFPSSDGTPGGYSFVNDAVAPNGEVHSSNVYIAQSQTYFLSQTLTSNPNADVVYYCKVLAPSSTAVRASIELIDAAGKVLVHSDLR